MIEAIRQFTTWTNDWKDRGKDEKLKLFQRAQSISLPAIRNAVEQAYRGTSATRGKPIRPKLPKREPKNDIVNIQFKRHQDDIDMVSEYLFEEHHAARVVGEACFDRVLKEAASI